MIAVCAYISRSSVSGRGARRMCHYDARRPFPCIRKQPVRPGPCLSGGVRTSLFFFLSEAACHARSSSQSTVQSQAQAGRVQGTQCGPCAFIYECRSARLSGPDHSSITSEFRMPSMTGETL